MARPISTEELRNRPLTVKFTQTEYNNLYKKAKEEYRTPSDFIRAVVLEYLKNEKRI